MKFNRVWFCRVLFVLASAILLNGIWPSFVQADTCSECSVAHALPVDCYYQYHEECVGEATAGDPQNGNPSYISTVVDTACDACNNSAGSSAAYSYSQTSGSKWSFCFGLEIKISGWTLKPNGCYEQNSQQTTTVSGSTNCNCQKFQYIIKKYKVPETIPITIAVSKTKYWQKDEYNSNCAAYSPTTTTENENCGTINETGSGEHLSYIPTTTPLDCPPCVSCPCPCP